MPAPVFAPVFPATEAAQPIQVEGLSGAERVALALFRVVGARCRVMARADLFRACAMLSDDKTRAAEAVATALIRGLTGAGGIGGLRLYQPGAPELSFDERWLLGALSTARRGDVDSLTFLLARRLPHHSQRQIGFLVTALGEALDRANGGA